MTDFAQRDAFEEQLAEALAELGQDAVDEIIAQVEANEQNDPLWLAPWLLLLTDRYAAILQPTLEAIYIEHVTALMQAGIAVDWSLINERAADWAQQYTYDLVRNITGNRQRLLQRSLDDFYRQRLTLGDLRKRLTREFGPVRAFMIAVTETTRAANQGEAAYIETLRGMGLTIRGYWETVNDDRVCPICGPRHGKAQGDGWTDLPPAHIKCRCNVRYVVEVLDEATKAVVLRWITAWPTRPQSPPRKRLMVTDLSTLTISEEYP